MHGAESDPSGVGQEDYDADQGAVVAVQGFSYYHGTSDTGAEGLTSRDSGDQIGCS